jgi:chromate transport protein ChrA
MQDIFRLLVEVGLIDVILPFVLVFTITYGILQRTKVLGETKRTSAMVAFTLGFFTVLTANLLNIINIILFYFVILLVISLMLALVFGMTGTGKNKLVRIILLGFAVLFVFLALERLGILTKNQFWTFAIAAIIIGLIVTAIARHYKEEKKSEKAGKPEKTVSAEGHKEI